MLLRKILQNTKRFSTAADAEHVIYRKYDPVVLIGINNPDNRNALNESMVNGLNDAISKFENDETAAAGVLFGEAGNFCAGYDLKELAKRSENPPEHFIENNLTQKYLRKPLIAAISGYAVGVGFDLALMCDLRVMETSAVFGYYGRRFGMSVSDFGIERLSAMIGFSKTLDLILSGRAMKSEEAFNIGLANRVVECGTAIGQALNFAHSIAKFPQAAVLKDRAVLYKKNFPDLSNKCEDIERDCDAYKEQIMKDIKKGSKIFAEGHGKTGILISKYLWSDISVPN